MRLIDIGEQLKQLVALVDSGELTQEDIAATLEGLEGMLDQKVESICFVLRDSTASIAGIDAEVKRLTERKRVLNAANDRLKDYLKMVLSETDSKKVKTDLWSVTLIPAKPVVSITDPEQVPDDFKQTHVDIRIDKKKLLAALKDSDTPIPGSELVPGKLGLRIS